jgi:uncharacterized membrane protein affecting hemolysin expression
MWVFVLIIVVLIGVLVTFYLPTCAKKHDETENLKTQESTASSVVDKNGPDDE